MIKIHNDLSERLPQYNKPLYIQVKGILEENKAERHIRGGIPTRNKYTGIHYTETGAGRHPAPRVRLQHEKPDQHQHQHPYNGRCGAQIHHHSKGEST